MKIIVSCVILLILMVGIIEWAIIASVKRKRDTVADDEEQIKNIC